MRDQFLFYRSYYESLKTLPKEDQADILMAIAGYALDEAEPELDGVPAAIFTLVKPTLDAAARKSAGGAKGKKKDTDKIGERYTEDTDKIGERYTEDTDKIGETIKDKGYKDKGYKDKGKNYIERVRDPLDGIDVPSVCQSVCAEFSRLTGSKDDPHAPYITDRVINILRQGYSEADILMVIRKKHEEWKDDPVMCNKIRPSTILGDKFAEYYAQPPVVHQTKKNKQRQKMERLAALSTEQMFDSEVKLIDTG